MVLTVWIWLPDADGVTELPCECAMIQFLDVGQGDAILITTYDGFEVLIDGGPDSGVLRALAAQRSFFDRSLDLVIATHPDLDHIGGLIDVFARFDVQTILQTENVNDTPAAVAFAAAAHNEDAEVILADAGQVISLGDLQIEILSPKGDESEWESNNASIITKITFGDTAFMLTGDAPAEIEEYLAGAYGAGLKADVLKLGHHGSKTSTSEIFLDLVDPQYAVVSAGLDNRYGHPHQEVLQRVFDRDIETSHTGTDGTITFISDGEAVWKE